MKRLLLIALALVPAAAGAVPPAVPLVVELRWVDSALAPAAQAAVRDGAVVVGTAGAVSPRGAGVVTSTAQAAPVPAQRLVVLNGQRASLRLTTVEPLQWVDAVVDMGPATGAAGPPARPRVYAAPRQGERRVSQTFTVTPSWPGGGAPVRVVFDVQQDDLGHASTQDLPLDRWQTVARTGTPVAPAERGTVSSTDAAGRPERALQLRVSVQP